jgi:ABC-type thiamin/hydroxymethylpyrimidine transport system permease subunit
MWQRKQTIFLAIAAASLILMIFFPVWQGKSESTTATLYPLYYKLVQGDVRTDVYFPYSIIAILAIAAATLAIFEIGKFEDRILQIKLGAVNSLLMAGSMGSAAYLAIQVIKSNQMAGSYGFALYLPAVAMVCNAIANRFIRKDEKLVRDSERLR